MCTFPEGKVHMTEIEHGVCVFMFLWTFVNLINAEGAWFMHVVATLATVAVGTHLLKKLLYHIEQRPSLPAVQRALLKALITPLGYFIWFTTLAYSVNMITDQFLTAQYIEELKIAFRVVAILTIAWFLMRFKSNMFKHMDANMDTGTLHSLSKLATVIIIIVTALLIMEATHQNFHTFIAFGGISGVAIAFASQEIIANFFWGVMIHIHRSFKVGDRIELPDAAIDGYVENIGWYQTLVRSLDKRPIYIPNTLFGKSHVINATRMTHRKVEETFQLRYDDAHRVSSIIEKIESFLTTHPHIHPDEMYVYIETLGPNSIHITISALSYCLEEKPFQKVKDTIFLAVADIVTKSGAKFATFNINIPAAARA